MTKYIVTDPCYLIDKDVWADCCKAAELPNHGWDNDLFNARVANELTKLTGQKAWASDTGFGDWDNAIHGNPDKIIQSEFCADSGMVSVCILTDDMEAKLRAEYPYGFNTLGAIIECDGEVHIIAHEWGSVGIDESSSYHHHSQCTGSMCFGKSKHHQSACFAKL